LHIEYYGAEMPIKQAVATLQQSPRVQTETAIEQLQHAGKLITGIPTGYDRFNEFTSAFSDSNFRNGDPTKWVITSAPLVNSAEAVAFYWPQVGDPNPLPGTHPIYSGLQHVWRTWAFGAGTPRVLAPRGARPGTVALRRLLEEGVAPDGLHEPAALADALRRLDRLARQPGLVVVVCDFREQRGWERPLGSLQVRHSVVAVEIVDPREAELPAAGHLALVDPETGARLEVDTSSRRLRQRFAELERERRAMIAGELRRLRAHHVTLSTADDWLLELGRQLR